MASLLLRQVARKCVPVRLLSRSALVSAKAPKMAQVEVDEDHVKQKLGSIQMEFVRIAEKQNQERAQRHKKFRRKDWVIAVTCFAIVISIYSYTIYAIKQERFLDDFDMPDPLAEDVRAKDIK